MKMPRYFYAIQLHDLLEAIVYFGTLDFLRGEAGAIKLESKLFKQFGKYTFITTPCVLFTND